MDYFTRYGLEFNPFIKNSKEILVDTSEYRETVFRLDYLAKTKGFGLLTGSPGRGKTTTIRSWASNLNPSLYKVIYSSLSTLTPNDFYRNLVMELGAEPAFKKPDNFRIIQEEITRLSLEKRKTPVIIIDEANYINNAILNDLKILFNFEMDSRDRAAILLAGLPKLNSTLGLSITLSVCSGAIIMSTDICSCLLITTILITPLIIIYNHIAATIRTFQYSTQ